MNRPDKASEPSMEEILASIRQIIADEPSNDAAEPVIEANPLVPQASPFRSHETRVPLADRLSGIMKDGPLLPTSPFGSKRPLSFDQDLADMLDAHDPLNGNGIAAPKPDIKVQPALAAPHPMTSKSFVPMSPTVAPQPAMDSPVAKPAAEEAPLSSSSQQAAVPQPAAPVQPVGDIKPAAESSPPPQTYGFPPFKKPSFFPPQSKAPVMPSRSLDDMPGMSRQEASPGTGDGGGATPANIDDTLRRIDSGLGSFIPGSSGAGAAPAAARPFATLTVPDNVSALDQVFGRREAPEASPSFAPSSAESSRPQAQANSYAATPVGSNGPSPAATSPAYSSFGATAPQQPIVGPAPDPFAVFESRPADARRPVPPIENPNEPRAYSDPFAANSRPASGLNGHRYDAQPMGTDAAHSALDALALGLAASAAHSAPQSEAVSPAIPLTPIIDVAPEPDLRGPPPAQPPPSNLPATVPSAGTMPVNRTLEDAVADMLRPMLQQWVADNMPRIIEKALRSEVEKTLKPRQKPSGT